MENQAIVPNPERKRRLIDESVQLLPGGVPLFDWVEVSPIEACNRRCAFCPKSDRGRFPNQPLEMHPVLYNGMAHQLGAMDYKGTVVLAGYGEPTMSRHIRDMVGVFSQVARVELVTNGDSLNVPAITRLIDAGVSTILVSLYDGPEQVDRFKGMFDSAKAPEESYVLREQWAGSADRDFVMKLTNRAGAIQSQSSYSLTGGSGLCYYPHYSMTVDWNGDVVLCMHDWNRRVKFGNLTYQSMLEVWSSRALDTCRKLLRAGLRIASPCLQCDAVRTGYGRLHAEAWDRYYAAKRTP